MKHMEPLHCPKHVYVSGSFRRFFRLPRMTMMLSLTLHGTSSTAVRRVKGSGLNPLCICGPRTIRT
ncbi:hypothetical protein PAXRUDRAFT_699290 [Paxillus rubicundulus Ve08.2h10]|uniref:Uncharacterized protein n=1 Tax=Paxillus rubicundulus Ve08.2h10 TaxID=930991 RepID=A0A0D0D6K4_9AGAM|nr:hypothetical protein PAXRUDRAFT_699290 [Paxillus rubicundulus Ve08.2h10]